MSGKRAATYSTFIQTRDLRSAFRLRRLAESGGCERALRDCALILVTFGLGDHFCGMRKGNLIFHLS